MKLPQPTPAQIVFAVVILGALVLYACWLPEGWAVAGLGQLVGGALKGLGQ